MMKTLMILRGLPGSGKSTLAALIVGMIDRDHFSVSSHSADDHMVDEQGNYAFDRDKLYHAHMSCQAEVNNSMVVGFDLIVVHNTSTTEKELKPYLILAAQHDYKVVSLVVENRHGGTNVHGVPEETLVAMKNRFTVSL
jgi:predicted kinase